MTDPNPILDEGAPTSTGSVQAAQRLCQIMGISLVLDSPSEVYLHGWGQKCLDAKLIRHSWTLTIPDRYGIPLSLTFDLTEGDDPLVVGLDVKEYADTINRGRERVLITERPDDKGPRTMPTYIGFDGDDKRLRLLIAPHRAILRISRSMMQKSIGNQQRAAQTLVRRVHRYTHAPVDDMIRIFDDAGILDRVTEGVIRNTAAACPICAGTGRPAHTKKVSLTHVNQAFNEEIQLDFVFVDIHDEKMTVIHIVDTGTIWSEKRIVGSRSSQVITEIIYILWLCQHGSPKAISADDEYNSRQVQEFCSTHNIEFKARPARRHNKTGLVERKNQTLKTVLERLTKDKTTSSPNAILARTTFLANTFSGNKALSSFALVRGYQPSILGLPSNSIDETLLNAHKQQQATRALRRILQSRKPTLLTSDSIQPRDDVLVYYRSSKQNEKDEWIQGTIVSVHPHFIQVRRSRFGRPMKVAYEDIRVIPKGELASKLMEGTVEDAVATTQQPEPQRQPDGQEIQGDPGGQQSANYNTPETGTHSTMMTRTEDDASQHAARDIGSHAPNVLSHPTQEPTVLESDRDRVLEDIYTEIGSKQVSASKLTFAPPWIIEQAFQKEHDSNWKDVYILVPEREVPSNANVISSHSVAKVKTNEEGKRDLKVRLCPHGNRDSEKDSIRKDSDTVSWLGIRILFAISVFLDFRLGTADIKGAYLQSGPIRRQIYVRPPREWQGPRGMLWLLTKLPYGIVEAGRQWMKTVEDWMLNIARLQRVPGISQLYTKKDTTDRISLLVAKVTDDFLVAGQVEAIKQFMAKLQDRFIVGKVIVDNIFHFNGCEVEQHTDGSIKVSMNRYLERLRPITISRPRRKQRSEKATAQEIRQYRSLSGTLLYLGNAVLPQAALITSLMQQKLGSLRVQHLVDANTMLKEILQLKPWMCYHCPGSIESVTIVSFSDASHTSRDKCYGQTGIIQGLRVKTSDGPMFYPLDWTSHKQNRVSYSPYGAEIIACSRADDRGFYIKMAMTALTGCHNRHELAVDSKALYDTATTLHQSDEYRLRMTVQRIRNSFESGELDVLRWIPGTSNIADALTKRNLELYRIVNDMFTTGRFMVDYSFSLAQDSKLWK